PTTADGTPGFPLQILGLHRGLPKKCPSNGEIRGNSPRRNLLLDGYHSANGPWPVFGGMDSPGSSERVRHFKPQVSGVLYPSPSPARFGASHPTSSAIYCPLTQRRPLVEPGRDHAFPPPPRRVRRAVPPRQPGAGLPPAGRRHTHARQRLLQDP